MGAGVFRGIFYDAPPICEFGGAGAGVESPTERAPQNRMQMNRLKDSTDEYAHNLMHLEVINASQAILRCILVHI